MALYPRTAIEEGCLCGGVIHAPGPGHALVEAAVREHLASLSHQRWRRAGGLERPRPAEPADVYESRVEWSA